MFINNLLKKIMNKINKLIKVSFKAKEGIE
jgi:hypothetical protein